MGNCGRKNSQEKVYAADRLVIEGLKNDRKLEAFWMRQLCKTDESDAGDFDFSGMLVWVKIVSVDKNGIATAISPMDISGTRQMKKIKVRFLNGQDASTMIGYVMRVRLFNLEYAWIDVV